jgi:hypothetical protein
LFKNRLLPGVGRQTHTTHPHQDLSIVAKSFGIKLLIPTVKLSIVLDETINDAKADGILGLGAEEVLNFCCRAMHNDFGVNFSSMQTRIRKSEFWPSREIPDSN